MRRARRVWVKAGLAPLGLHEARHTFASVMIAAGVDAKALASYIGHSSVTITLDRYGHLCPATRMSRPNCSTFTSLAAWRLPITTRQRSGANEPLRSKIQPVSATNTCFTRLANV